MGCHHRAQGSVFHQILEKGEVPDPAKAAIAGATQDVNNYPFTYIINQLANTGGKATIGGKTYDFTGKGQADISAKLSDPMAQALLDIQGKYGADFIKQRLEDLKQSDPTGYAARQQLFDKIISDSKNHPNQPLAQETQDAISSELQRGGKLDSKETEQVQQGVRGQQGKSGIYLGNAAATQEAEAVESTGEQLRTQRQQQAEQYQTLGISPEDVQFRQIQQDLQNLGAAVNQQTPTSQFKSLSGAQNQAAPFTNAPQNNANINLGQSMGQGIGSAFQNYNTSQQQANPYLAGASTGLSAYGAFNNIFGNIKFGSGSSPQVSMGAGGSQSSYPTNW